MAHEENARIARSVYEAFNDRDFGRGLEVVAQDAEWLNVATGEVFRGRDEFRRNFEQWAAAFPDGRCEEIEVHAGDGFAVVQFTGRGTNTGPLRTPQGEIPATGRRVAIQFCDVHRITAGKIAGGRAYWDMATMMAQLGLLPELPVATHA
jgi:steroid delta-isomerase-like uncharacterized protein